MSVFITDANGTLIGAVLLNDEQADLYQESLAFQYILQVSNRQVTLGAAQQEPPLSPALLLSALSSDNGVLIDDYPFELLNLESDVPPNIYTLSPSGQVVLSGTAPITFTPAGAGSTYTLSPSGGVVFSGVSEYSRIRVQTPTGLVALSGSAGLGKIRTQVASGQITFSGSVSVAHIKVESVSGQITFSGSSPLSFIPGSSGSGGANQRTLVGVGI